ncbi:MAG: phosphoribosylanthranilate isomerase [Clostridiaceae bacterium]|nr:phosphoribosylanthranilate isomerase [Clostridiaceae bacterium]
MAKIKICGLMREQDIDAVNKALPDYIGFVFARSKRQIDEKKAKELKAGLNPLIKAVGVFVNEEIKNIINLCNSNVIDIIQLHGDENEDYIRRLKNSVSNKIIKAVRVKDLEDIKKAMEITCDYLLFDAYHEGKYGGLGKTFDWSVIPDMGKPYFLAGGINSSNIMRAIQQLNPFCIDVSSGVETNGYKDPEKIMDIVAKVRQV